MTMQNDTFYPFSRLPKELREDIWRYCLPYRVFEAHFPVATVVYDALTEEPMQCLLQATTYMNSRPPALTRVCYESRHLTFKAGGLNGFELFEGPEDERWDSHTRHSPGTVWEDRTRDIAHMHWVPEFHPSYPTWGNPIPYIAAKARYLSGIGSVMIYNIDQYFGNPFFDDDEDQDDDDEAIGSPAARQLPPLDAAAPRNLETLLQIRSWLVVMRIIVVHCDHKTAAMTGLFGLLGDAWVHVVDVAEEPKVNAFFDFAEKCETGEISKRQDFSRTTIASMEQQLRGAVIKRYRSEELAERVRPAYMFRLCTQMCNHLKEGPTTRT